ncbi:hypothetical protein JCM8202_001908 [Rhodotorula sphaerocarpa]
MLPLLLLSLAASLATATKILVPLYSWSPDCWPELQTAAAANPDVEFFLILNPNSGPIRDVQDPSLYCVPTLRARIPRSTLIGYVRTGYGSRPAGQVDADVATYASWADLRVDVQGAGAPKLDGIFFDEVPDGTTRKLKDLYAGYAETARAAFPNGTVVMNPGTNVGPDLYADADLVVAPSALPPAEYLPSSAIMIHSFPPAPTPPNSTSNLTADPILLSTLQDLIPAAGAVYLTDLNIKQTDVYGSFGPDWQDFVKAAAGLNARANVTTSAATPTETLAKASTGVPTFAC